MMANLRARRKAKSAIQRLKRREREFVAITGDGRGTVAVPGVDNAIRARHAASGAPLIVWNFGQVALLENLAVRVVRKDGLLQVAGVKAWVGSTIPSGAGVGPHGSTHGPIGNALAIDPVYIDTSQIVPLLVYLGGGLTVKINTGIYDIGWKLYMLSALQTVDLTSYVPDTSGYACYVLIEVDAAGTVYKTASSDILLADLQLSDAPSSAPGRINLATVRLINGKTALTMDDLWVLHVMPRVDLTSFNVSGAQSLLWYVDGTLAAATDVGANYAFHAACTIVEFFMMLKSKGTSSSTIVTVNKNGSTLMSIEYPYDQVDDVLISGCNTAIVAGDFLTLDITAAAPGSASLTMYAVTTNPFEAQA